MYWITPLRLSGYAIKNEHKQVHRTTRGIVGPKSTQTRAVQMSAALNILHRNPFT